MASPVVTQPINDKMLWFRTPPRIFSGWGSLAQAFAELKQTNFKKAFIITDRHVAAAGYLLAVADKLKSVGVVVEDFRDVTSNPSEAVIQTALDRMNVFGPDQIIALGGGSVIDVAKVVRLVYDPNNAQPDLKAHYAHTYKQLLTDRLSVDPNTLVGSRFKPLICIPTTSGTGAEMTPIAWVTDRDGRKKSILSWCMTADAVIVDGFFVKQLPSDIAAATGFDAFAKAIESMVSNISNDYTQGFSLQAARLIHQNLEASVKEGRFANRAAMHNAASIAGIAAGNAFVGAAHALAFGIQDIAMRNGRDLPFGAALAVVLPQVVEFNGEVPEIRCLYARLAEFMGICSNACDDEAKWQQLIERVREVRGSVGLPTTLAAVGLTAEVVESALDEIVNIATSVVGAFLPNARSMSTHDMKGILRNCA